MKSVIIFIINLVLLVSFETVHCQSTDIINDVTYIDLGTETLIKSEKRGLHVFCYSGRSKRIFYIWQTVSLNVKITRDDFELYEGNTPLEVYKQYEERRSSWSFNLFTNKKKTFNLNPFNQSCIGVDTSQNYSVELNFLRIDFWKLVYLLVGLILYIGAPKLSNNKFFYYSSGVLIGICAAFLFLIYFMSKMIPKKPAMYGFALGGWALFLYFMQILWDNLQVVLLSYKTYVAWYIVVSGVISFFICYRMDPLQNEKNRKIVKWSLQFVGLIFIAFHTDYQEAAIAMCCVIIAGKYFSETIVKRTKMYWRKKFPPKITLLTSEEYYSQGVKETCKALQELREHCNSPECKQWNTILKLKDAKRFAKFVQGESHLTDQEILEYDSDEINSYEMNFRNHLRNKYRNNGRISLTDDEEDDSDRISEDGEL
ncbi:nuclear envelope integral membrane protein 1-like isoform X1 [Ctenocephalides felis]|uniref:nuclear envelope integral membrane protein 1-like isoform X1 n=1 Tax=Ctenocephalides felis TaxID=7515 RepID=UPI000E6E3753|nr:nuclear envelope integral membrane protein 1-like isoform X1 [Ctenocephalides felis]